jgi:hypothetical protein
MTLRCYALEAKYEFLKVAADAGLCAADDRVPGDVLPPVRRVVRRRARHGVDDDGNVPARDVRRLRRDRRRAVRLRRGGRHRAGPGLADAQAGHADAAARLLRRQAGVHGDRLRAHRHGVLLAVLAATPVGYGCRPRLDPAGGHARGGRCPLLRSSVWRSARPRPQLRARGRQPRLPPDGVRVGVVDPDRGAAGRHAGDRRVPARLITSGSSRWPRSAAAAAPQPGRTCSSSPASRWWGSASPGSATAGTKTRRTDERKKEEGRRQKAEGAEDARVEADGVIVAGSACIVVGRAAQPGREGDDVTKAADAVTVFRDVRVFRWRGDHRTGDGRRARWADRGGRQPSRCRRGRRSSTGRAHAPAGPDRRARATFGPRSNARWSSGSRRSSTCSPTIARPPSGGASSRRPAARPGAPTSSRPARW